MFRPMMINYTIRNKRRLFPLYSIRIVELFDPEQVEEMPRVFIPCIGPGKSCSFQVYVTPKNRGPMMCLGTRIASKYPFGLLTRFRTVTDSRHVDIYPALGSLTTRLLPANRNSEYQMGEYPAPVQGQQRRVFCPAGISGGGQSAVYSLAADGPDGPAGGAGDVPVFASPDYGDPGYVSAGEEQKDAVDV